MKYKALNILAITLYLCDLFIAGHPKSQIAVIKKDSFERFEIQDLASANAILGIELDRNTAISGEIFICQSSTKKSS